MADKTLEQMYIAAYNRVKSAATAADYQEAITLLKKCNGFADSESMIQQCEKALFRLSQEETYQNALSLSEKRDVVFLRKAETLFEELGDYKDSMRRLSNVRIKIAKQSSGDPESVEIVCPKCGHINHGGSCCSKCGAPFQKTEPAGNHRKRNLLIIGSIALLALVIGIAVFVHQSDLDEPIYDDEQSELSSDDISGTSYDDIIAQYQRVIDFDFDPETYNERLTSDYYNYCYIANTPLFYRAKGPVEITISYALCDINRDEIDELIIQMNDGTLIDIFTMSSEGAVSLFGEFFDMYDSDSPRTKYPVEGYEYASALGYRENVAILSSGEMLYESSWPGSTQWYSYTLPPHETAVTLNYGVSMEGSNYYELLPDGSKHSCTQQKYDDISSEMDQTIYSDSNMMKMDFSPIS